MRLFILPMVSVLIALATPGCRSEPSDDSSAQSAAISVGRVEVQPGVLAVDARMLRAFDGLTEVRVQLVNTTASTVSWPTLRDADVSLNRPAGTALLRTDSPGRRKPIVIPARSSALVSFLFDSSALDATTLMLFGHRVAMARS